MAGVAWPQRGFPAGLLDPLCVLVKLSDNREYYILKSQSATSGWGWPGFLQEGNEGLDRQARLPDDCP